MSNEVRIGKYRLIAELGHGGMADVFLALVEGPVGSGFAKLAVIKRLRSNLAEDPDFVTMLVDEARITARLNHPNVVQLLEVGVENEEYFLAMEYLDGQPLHRIERRATCTNSPLARDVYIGILQDVLTGLHHAHELVDYDGTPLNIVHRDITPHNIFVTYEGQVKVMDFGIAKASGRAQETQHGIVKGKVRFMSPEQAMSQALDRRADIFAVGILLWQALTGKRFWTDLDDLAIVQQLIAGDYNASPRAIDPTIPEELDRICQKALARNPEDRYATALEMREEIEAASGVSYKARRELSSKLADLFAKERRELRAVVERAGKESLSMTASTALRSGAASSTSIPAVVNTVPPPRMISNAPASAATPASSSISMAPPPRRAWHWVVSASAVAVALMTLAVGTFEAPHARAATSSSVVVSDVVQFETTPPRPRAVRPKAEPAAAPPVVVYVPVPAKHVPPPAVASASPSQPIAPVPPMPKPATQAAPRARGARLSVDSSDPWTSQ